MANFPIERVPSFYQGYVGTVQTLGLFEALAQTGEEIQQVTLQIPEERGAFAYAEGKWTVKEVLAHIIDAERIFAYRALRFARNDNTNLPGFDETAYTPQSNANGRTITMLARELANVRISSIDLFRSFTPDMLGRSGLANNTEIAVDVLGYVIAGHGRHHLRILKERYLDKK